MVTLRLRRYAAIHPIRHRHPNHIGYKNAVINVKLDHLGGQTAVFPEYQEWARLLGGDAFFHKRNHEIFNAKWGARLGVIVMPDWRVEWKV